MQSRLFALGVFCLTALPSAWAFAERACVPPPALRRGPETPDRLSGLGNWYAEHGQSRCAEETFRRGLGMAPASAALHYGLGIALLSRAKPDQASTELRQVLKL